MKPPFVLLTLVPLLATLPASAEFTWTDTGGKHLELTFQNRPVARYLYEAIDESSPERRDETYKPFCHIYRPDKRGEFLTKGPGGKFTHHRGIYYGVFQNQLHRSRRETVEQCRYVALP